MSKEPEVEVPMPLKYGAPHCPNCGYRCGCCCFCECQTPCGDPVIEEGEKYCDCLNPCHGGHEPWDCYYWSTRYRWSKEKSARLENE